MAFLTDILLPVTLMLTGVFLTFRLDLVQLRYLKDGLKNTLSGIFSKEKSDGISPFAALAASLGAQLGTGNIAGAGSAIITGGPGAVFWMWTAAFFGMATSYSEAVLSQKTKVKHPDGHTDGGAPYYIKEAFSGKTGKLLSGAFCLFSTAALGFTGVGVQSNSVSYALKEAFGLPVAVSAVFLTLFSLIILRLDTKKLTSLSAKAIPLMTVLYVLVSISVIIKNIDMLGNAFLLIFRCAFSPGAFLGATFGISVKTAVAQGIKRGLFTNEAGMGSTSAAHSLSDAPTAHYQGTMGIAGVFIDTFLMLSLTAIAVICVLYRNPCEDLKLLSGSEAVSLAFSDVLGTRGASAFIAVSILLFAFASIIGWSSFGKTSCIYLFGEKSSGIYTLSSLIFVFVGACISSDFIWNLTDVFNAFMVFTNVPALIKLSSRIKKG